MSLLLLPEGSLHCNQSVSSLATVFLAWAEADLTDLYKTYSAALPPWLYRICLSFQGY